MIRVYISPCVGTGTRHDPFRSKALGEGLLGSAFLPSKVDGTPATHWTLAIVAADDFATLDEDVAQDDLFAGELPDTLNTREELIEYLRSRKLEDLTSERSEVIFNVLDRYGISYVDFDGATPLWRVMQRVASTLLEQDDNFASSF